jgi:hypothetical protein
MAKIRLYLNFHYTIKIKTTITAICVHLCSSAVNNEIEIIPACFISNHALSVGCEWCVLVVASGVVGCCRWVVWLLKYINYKISHRKARRGRKVEATLSL